MTQIAALNNKKHLLINLLFASIPLTFIIGTSALNLNICLFIIVSLSLFFKDFLKLKLSSTDKIIIIFFIFIFFTGLFNTVENYYFGDREYIYLPGIPLADGKNHDFTILLKTFAYLRYLILYFTLKLLIEKNYLKFNLFFISSSFFCLFVSLDIIFQYFVGVDIFGYESPTTRKLSGPFHEELIAGSYIQRFSLFLLFLFPIFYKIKNRIILPSICLFLFSLIFVSIIMSGNRVPFVLFLITIFLIVITEKQLKKYLWFILLFGSMVFAILFYTNKSININFKNFFRETAIIVKVINPVNLFKDYDFNRADLPEHFDEFESFYDTWHMNKFIGGGVRSFRLNCPKRKNIYIGPTPESSERGTCNTHPHNYYLEILTELGLVGFIMFLLIISKVLWNYINLNNVFEKNSIQRKIIVPFFMLLLVEIFPLKSSGSFFASSNSTFIFILLGVTIALINKRKT